MKTLNLNLKYTLATLLLGALFSSGCARSKSANLMAPPVVYKSDSLSTGGLEFSFNPQVDILFVIDNSESMKEEQEKLKQAADQFVENFGENSLLDYRIGIISVYDSERCGAIDKKTGQRLECYPKGQLQPLKSALPLSTPYITRFDGAKDVLRESLKIGLLPLNQGGPRFEDFFSPTLVAISPEQNKLNGNFFREGAKAVIIFVTDEDDNNPNNSVDTFVMGLDARFGRDNYDLYAVLTVPKKNGAACARNSYADAPERLMEAVEKTNGRVFSICEDSFGADLGKIGSDIRQKMLNLNIVLKSIPEAGTLRLMYGDKVIPAGAGWSYNPQSQTISIRDNLKVDFDPKAKFSVDYVRVEQNAIDRGQAIPNNM